MASPSATATEIINGALQELGVLAAGEAASAADSTTAGEWLDRLIDDMNTDRGVNFDKGNVPDEAKDGLVHILAAGVAHVFGCPLDRLGVILPAAERARRNFRARAATAAAQEPVAFVDY